MTDYLDEFYNLLPEDKVELFKEMAEKAIQLGYKPKREKTKHLSISFSSNKYRTTILKYVYEKNRPTYRLKFFASKNYSAIFDRSIKETIEKFNFKYTGCYGCEKCIGGKEGYDVNYEDGRRYFRCGFELIEIVDLNKQIKEEVIELLELQTAYYENKRPATHTP
jgi:hypothetical protein